MISQIHGSMSFVRQDSSDDEDHDRPGSPQAQGDEAGRRKPSAKKRAASDYSSAEPSSSSATRTAVVAGFAALFISSLLHGSHWQPHFDFINFARVFFPKRMPEWNEHPGVKVQHGLLNRSQCRSLIQEARLRTVPTMGSDGLELETTHVLCAIPKAIDAARRVLNATSSAFGVNDLRIDDLNVLRRRVPITRPELQEGPLPWYLMLPVYTLDFFIGESLEYVIGESMFARYRWSFNGDAPRTDRCRYDTKTGKCTLDRDICCAWRTHTAVLFLTGESDGFFSGGDFAYLNPYSWSRWLSLQHWRGWVRVEPQCGTLVMFENALEPALVHSMVPIWSTEAGQAFTHAGRYTLNMWFTNVDDKEAAGHFAEFANSRANFHDYGTWPKHRCLGKHSSWDNAADEPLPDGAVEENLHKDSSLASRFRGRSHQGLGAFSRFAAADVTTTTTTAEPIPQARFIQPSFEPEPPTEPAVGAAPIPVASAEWHAATRAFDDQGRRTAVRQPLNVPGGPKMKAHLVFQEAIEYIKEHRDSAMAILKRLAPKLGVSESNLHTSASGDVLLRGFAMQANLQAVRERLRDAKVQGADSADRSFGVASLLLNTARGGPGTRAEGMMEL